MILIDDKWCDVLHRSMFNNSRFFVGRLCACVFLVAAEPVLPVFRARVCEGEVNGLVAVSGELMAFASRTSSCLCLLEHRGMWWNMLWWHQTIFRHATPSQLWQPIGVTWTISAWMVCNKSAVHLFRVHVLRPLYLHYSPVNVCFFIVTVILCK